MKRLLASSLLACALLQGCVGTTTPVGVAYKMEGTTITTVNSAMMAWGDWVRLGNATQKQVDTVKQVYAHYYTAQLAAKTAVDNYLLLKTDVTKEAVLAATADVATLKNELLTLLQPVLAAKGGVK